MTSKVSYPELTENEQAFYKELLLCVESEDEYNEETWGTVYLDNTLTRHNNPMRFAALTGSLAKKGLYKELRDTSEPGVVAFAELLIIE